jgi:hypothetical protein
MDDQRRFSLRLIEDLAVQLPLADRGQQLVFVVDEYISFNEMNEARRVLRLIPEEYFEEHMLRQALGYRLFGEAVARIIEAWGYDFWILARPAVGTS